MNKFVSFAFSAMACTMLVSCLVENDMAYPKVPAEILAFEVSGQESVTIDNESRTISIVLSETADIAAVEVTRFEFSEMAACEGLAQGQILDLTSPVSFILRTYQEYDWIITAARPIERYVKCQGQTSEPEFDLNNKLVYVYVSDKQDVTSIVFEALKFEPEGSVIKGYEEEGEVVPFDLPLTLNCNFWRYFIVEYNGEQFRWGVNVVTVEVSLGIESCNAWSSHADFKGVFGGAGEPYFQYRKSGEEAWTDLKEVTVSGTSVTASATGLEPGTQYDVRLVDGTSSVEDVFTTEEALQLHNLSFDAWWQDGKVWYPDESASYQIWDSANPGSGGFGIIPTTPESSDVAVSGEGKNAARLESKKALIVLAAGNIYTGKFGATSGLGASLDWGVPFTSRPLALKGYYKYQPKTIDMAKDPYTGLKGQSDTCQIMIFLTDWDQPFTVNTNTGTFVDLDNDPSIIAFGKLEDSRSMSGYEQFEIELDYRDTVRKPKYIVITACSSKYGDYFTGGVGSTLLVDEFELLYE